MTSVTDGGATGDTDHVFNVDFSGINYVPVFGGEKLYTTGYTYGTEAAGTITTVSYRTSTDAANDMSDAHMAIFGDQ